MSKDNSSSIMNALTFSEAKEAIHLLFLAKRSSRRKCGHTPFLLGHPGIGKTNLVNGWVEYLNNQAEFGQWEILDNSLLQMDPTDLSAPFFEEVDGRKLLTKVAPGVLPLKGLPTSAKGKNVIFFLDDFKQASPLMQNLATNLMDGRVGDYELDQDRIFIISAANRIEDNAGVFDSPSNLTNRVCVINVKEDLTEWADWATTTKHIKSEIIPFLQNNVEFFCQRPPDHDNLPFPTPRQWEAVSDVLKIGKNFENLVGAKTIAQELVFTIMCGLVGVAASSAFLKFHQLSYSNVARENILNGTDLKYKPKDVEESLAIIHSVNHTITEELLAKEKEKYNKHLFNLLTWMKTINTDAALYHKVFHGRPQQAKEEQSNYILGLEPKDAVYKIVEPYKQMIQKVKQKSYGK